MIASSFGWDAGSPSIVYRSVTILAGFVLFAIIVFRTRAELRDPAALSAEMGTGSAQATRPAKP